METVACLTTSHGTRQAAHGSAQRPFAEARVSENQAVGLRAGGKFTHGGAQVTEFDSTGVPIEDAAAAALAFEGAERMGIGLRE